MKMFDDALYEARGTVASRCRYYLVNSLGALTGDTVTVQRGRPLPTAPSGFVWKPETAALLRTRAQEWRMRARWHWPQIHADAMLAFAVELEAKATLLEQAGPK